MVDHIKNIHIFTAVERGGRKQAAPVAHQATHDSSSVLWDRSKSSNAPILI